MFSLFLSLRRHFNFSLALALLLCLMLTTNDGFSYSASEKAPIQADYWSTDAILQRSSTTTGLNDLFYTYKSSQHYLALNHPIQSAYVGTLYAYLIENDHPKALRLLNEGTLLAQEAKDYDALLLFYRTRVNYYADYGDSLHLLAIGETLLNMTDSIYDPRYEALAYYSLAIGHYNAADDKTALAYLNKFSSTLKETKSANDAILYHIFMSYIQLHAGNLEAARIQISEIKSIGDSLNQDTWLIENSRLHANLLSLLLDCKRGLPYEQVWKNYESIRKNALQTPLGYESWNLNLNEFAALISDHYGLYAQAISYYETYLEQCDQIIYLSDVESPTVHIKLQLATDYYQISAYQKAAKLYNSIYLDSVKPEKSSEYTLLINRIKTLSEKELMDEIELLNSVRKADEARIEAQKSVILLLITIFGMLTLGALILIWQYGRMRTLKNRIFEQSITDFLTQVNTRARVFQILTNLDLSAKSYCVALLDIDNFKQINDRFGHVVGDEVLIKVAQTIKASIRETDIVGRYGGEEFICVIHTTDADIIRQVTERIRASVESMEWHFPGLVTTISIGATIHPGQCFPQSIEEADVLLYEAKNNGKNKVVFKVFE